MQRSAQTQPRAAMRSRWAAWALAFVASIALLVSSIRTAPDAVSALAVAVHTGSNYATSRVSSPSSEDRVTRALAPSLDIAQVDSTTFKRGGGDDGSGWMPAPVLARHTTVAISTLEPTPGAAWERWESIERPTRARARLMVFLN